MYQFSSTGHFKSRSIINYVFFVSLIIGPFSSTMKGPHFRLKMKYSHFIIWVWMIVESFSRQPGEMTFFNVIILCSAISFKLKLKAKNLFKFSLLFIRYGSSATQLRQFCNWILVWKIKEKLYLTVKWTSNATRFNAVSSFGTEFVGKYSTDC